MAAHRRADRLQVGQHRPRPADAVEPDDGRARGLDPLARLRRREAVARHGLAVECERHDGGQAGLLDRIERDQRLFGVRERLGDDEIDAGLGRPPRLLVEHGAHRPARLVVGREDVRVREVAREERAALARDVARQLERLPVQRLEQMLLADDPHLLAMAVVRERLHHVRAGVDELAVQLDHDLRVVEHDLRDEGARLQVATALALEEVALGTDHGPLFEPLEQSGLSVGRHVATLLA